MVGDYTFPIQQEEAYASEFSNKTKKLSKNIEPRNSSCEGDRGGEPTHSTVAAAEFAYSLRQRKRTV